MSKKYARLFNFRPLLFVMFLAFIGNAQAQYCIPNYTNAGNCATTDLITAVSIQGTSLSHTNNSCSGVSRFFNFTTGSSWATLYRNASYNTYQLSVTSNVSSIISVWIDFNKDSIFSASEWWQVTTASTANTASTVTITIPTNAKIGDTRMRIRSRNSGNQNGDTSSCHAFGSGVGYDYKITIDSLASCSSSLSAGTLNVLDTVCASDTFKLSLAGNSALAVGQKFVWRKSNNGTNWTILDTTNVASYSIPTPSSAYYSCYTYCPSFKDSTAAKFVFAQLCYCSVSYSTGAGAGDYISKVILDSINNSTGASSAPYNTYYNNISTTLQPTHTYLLKAAPGSYASNNNIAAFIDFNKNGLFEASEQIGLFLSKAAFALDSVYFTVPATADTGRTRMRIIESYNTSNFTGCGNYSFGEAEDYTIYIRPNPCTTNAGNVVAIDTICKSASLQLNLDAGPYGSTATFDWQYSADNQNWTSFGTFTNDTIYTNILSNYYFRSIMSCGAYTDTTAAKQVIAKSCYCTPTYTNGTGAGDYIAKVKLGAINNVTVGAASPYYTYYNAQTTTLNPAKSYYISLTPGTYATGNAMAAWIDFDNNGTFDASEKLGELTAMAGSSTDSIYFTVPTGIDTGITRLRVMEVYSTSNLTPCGAYTFGETEDYNIYIKDFVCTTPVAGTITSLDSICKNDTLSLSLVGASFGSNATIQWQYSMDGATWNNYSNSNSLTFDAIISKTTYIRCYLACNGSADTSAVKMIYGKSCYCTSTYSNGTGGGDYISKVILDSINNTTGGSAAPYYTYYKNLSTTLNASATYTLKFAPGTYPTGNALAAWIDYNQNGIFEASEKLGQKSGIAASKLDSIQFTVPATVDSGLTRMRVMDGYLVANMEPCDNYTFGETEDYNIYIKNVACTTPPNSGSIVGDLADACVGDAFHLNLIGTSAGSGLTYQWQQSADSINWTSINGATGINYQDTLVNTIYYRAIVNCSGGKDTTDIYMIAKRASNVCYCKALHTVGCAANDLITKVVIQNTSLNNTISSCNGTSSVWTFPATGNTTAQLNKGYSSAIEVTNTTSSIVSVWIDYNQDGVYDSTEWTQVTTNSTANTPASATINIPSTALEGLTGMRVRSRVSGNPNGKNDACTAFGSGSTHDYLITINNKPNKDISITSMNAPIGKGCFSNAETVSITLANTGKDSIDLSLTNANIQTQMKVGTSTTFNNTLVNSGILAPGQTKLITISNTFDMSTQGVNYHFNFVIQLAGDSNKFNDTLKADIFSTQPIRQAYIQNFDTIASIPSDYISYGFTTSANQGVGGTDAIRVTGTNAADSLYTPIIGPLTTRSALRFNYKLSSKLPAKDSIYIKASFDCGRSYQNLGFIDSASAGTSGTYHALQIPLGAYTNNNIEVALFRYNNSGKNYSLYIDNMAIGDIPNPSLGGNYTNCGQQDLIVNKNGAACSIKWSTGTNQNNDTLTVTSSGTYTVFAADDTTGIVGTDSSVVTISLAPYVALGNDTSICPGSQLNLGNANLPANYTYVWSTGDTTSTIVVSSAGTYTYTVTDTGGCTATDSISVSITTLPSGVDFVKSTPFYGEFNTGSISNPDQVCAGSQVTYGIKPPSSYTNNNYNTKWTILSTGIETSSGTASGGAFTFTQPGGGNAKLRFTADSADQDSTFMIWATIKDLLTGCDTTVTRYVYINARPNLNLGGNQNICVGTKYTFKAAGFSTYTWSNGSTNDSITVGNPGKYKVTITNAIGCRASDSSQLQNYITKKVNLGPDAKTCPGNDYTFSAGNFSSYLWSNGSAADTLTTKSTGKYYIAVTDSNGCASSDTINLSNFKSPVVNLGLDRQVCVGTNVTFNAGVFNTYMWNTGATSSSIMVSKAGPYMVEVTDGNGCVGNDTVNLSNFPAVVVNLGTDKSICSGNPIYLDAGIANGHLWSDGSTTQTIQVTVPGTYFVRNADANGCYGYDTVIVKSGAIPNSAFSYSRVDANAKVQFTAADQTLASYNWDFGDANSSSLASPLHLYITTGSYTAKLTVTSTEGCKDNSSQVVFINTGTNNIIATNIEARVIPNPFESNTQLHYILNEQSQVAIDLFDITGRKIASLSQAAKQAAGEYILPINTADYNAAQGIYIIRMTLNDQVINLRIVDLNGK
jgi:hypothetical protein